MRLSPHIFAVILLLVPHGVLAKDAVTAAAPASTQAQASNKGAIGALAQDVDCQLAHPATGHTMAHAVLIVDVETDGPAYKRGLRTGDYLIGVNGSAVSQCSEIAPILAKITADGMIRLELLRAGQVVTIEAPRQNYSEQKPELDSKAAAEKASEIVAKNQETRPVQLSDEQRAVIAAYTRNIKAQLAAAPEGTDARAIIKDMQNIRNVFRDSDSTRDGWMT
ncbi:MAG: PDZ domain-containing protein, partial [Akkermansia sp.]